MGADDEEFARHGAAAAVLLLAGVVASVLPALRTTRVDPMVALREQ